MNRSLNMYSSRARRSLVSGETTIPENNYQLAEPLIEGAEKTNEEKKWYKGSVSSFIFEVKVILEASLPIIGGMLLETITPLINIYFLSDESNPDYMAALGLGSMWVGCLGSSLCYGLAAGLETLAAQAFGAEDYKLVAGYLHKTLALITTLFVPMMFLMFKADVILVLFGIQQEVVDLAAHYIIWLSPSILFLGYFDSLRCFLNAQNIFNVQMATAMIVYASHALWCKIFLGIVDNRLTAIALAKNTTCILNVVILYIVLKAKGLCEKTLIPVTKKSAFKGWGTFVKQAAPIGAILYLEMLCFELYTIFAGNLHDAVLLAAHVAASSTSVTYYSFGQGLSIAMTTIVGNSVGSAKRVAAQRYSAMGIVISNIINLVFIVGIFAGKYYWAGFFFADRVAIDILIDLLPYAVASYCVESLQITISGIVRGLGKAHAGMIAYFVGFFIVGQPLALLLTFYMGMGLKGIWLGIFAGNFVIVVYFLYDLITMDWRKQITIVRQDMENERAALVTLTQSIRSRSSMKSDENAEEMKVMSNH